ncbi:hypothetical protein ACZ87_03368, partial [Candidatus Erwinia dacicola]
QWHQFTIARSLQQCRFGNTYKNAAAVYAAVRSLC